MAKVNIPINANSMIIALGGELKSSLCTVTDGVATLDDSFGDLRMVENYRQFAAAAAAAAAHGGTGQIIIAHDMHPLYLSTQLASKMRGDLAGDGKNVKLLAVHGRAGQRPRAAPSWSLPYRRLQGLFS